MVTFEDPPPSHFGQKRMVQHGPGYQPDRRRIERWVRRAHYCRTKAVLPLPDWTMVETLPAPTVW